MSTLQVTHVDGPIPMNLWGKDHWSTLAYLETRIVDHRGELNLNHMRSNPNKHPGHANILPTGTVVDGSPYPTRLNNNTEVHFHDDWSCLDDAEELGLVENIGTGLNRVYKLTDLGWNIAGQLRRFMAEGTGKSKDFTPKVPKRLAKT